MNSLGKCIERYREYAYSYVSYTTSSGKQYYIIFDSHNMALHDEKFLYIRKYCCVYSREDYVSHYNDFINVLCEKELIVPLKWINNFIVVDSIDIINIEYRK